MNWLLIDPLTLPSIAIEKRRALEPIRAVYFLIEGDSEVIYIGETYNLKQRWGSHHCLETYRPSGRLRIAWIEMEDDRMRSKIEESLIWSYMPRLNHTSGHGCYGRGPSQPFLRKEANGK